MLKRLPTEFIFQVFALLVAVVLVHTAYVALVRPQAASTLEAQALRIEQDAGYVPEQTIAVVIKDYEQEACFILLLWALAIMGYKAMELVRERGVLESELIPLGDGIKILPEDTREYARQLQAFPEEVRQCLLPRVLLAGLQRFESTRNVQDVSALAENLCNGEGDRLESELSMIRYIAWAIPSLGFIGTVRGIGSALGQAHQAMSGDISNVTQSLGVAFNSTFVALVLSIVLMFLIHQLQASQERLVRETRNQLDQRWIHHFRV